MEDDKKFDCLYGLFLVNQILCYNYIKLYGFLQENDCELLQNDVYWYSQSIVLRDKDWEKYIILKINVKNVFFYFFRIKFLFFCKRFFYDFNFDL